MAICKYCNLEMLLHNGCTVAIFEFSDKPGDESERIPFGDPRERILRSLAPYLEYCSDCAVRPGDFHHVDCDAETCPRCLGQALSCACASAGL